VRLRANVNRQGEKAHADYPQRFPLNVLTPGRVEIVVKPPEQSGSRRDHDQAVEAETDERDGPGYHSCHYGDHSLKAVPCDGAIFELFATNPLRRRKSEDTICPLE